MSRAPWICRLSVGQLTLLARPGLLLVSLIFIIIVTFTIVSTYDHHNDGHDKHNSHNSNDNTILAMTSVSHH